jgi:hypothetical protein
VAHDFAVADLFDQRGYFTWGRGLPSIEFSDIGPFVGDGREVTAAYERRLENRDGKGRVIGHLSPGQAEFLHDLTDAAFAGTPILAEVYRLQRGVPPHHDVVAAYDMSDEQIELFLATTWVTLDVGTGNRARPERQQVLGRKMGAMAWGTTEARWIAEETDSDIRLDYQVPFAGLTGWGTPGPGPGP